MPHHIGDPPPGATGAMNARRRPFTLDRDPAAPAQGSRRPIRDARRAQLPSGFVRPEILGYDVAAAAN